MNNQDVTQITATGEDQYDAEPQTDGWSAFWALLLGVGFIVHMTYPGIGDEHTPGLYRRLHFVFALLGGVAITGLALAVLTCMKKPKPTLLLSKPPIRRPFPLEIPESTEEKSTVEFGPDLQLMSWIDGSGVPTSGHYRVIAGTDSDGLLHIRTFDPHGIRTDTFETRDNGGALHLDFADASGEVLSDAPESSLPTIQAGAITTLKQQLPGLLPPHVLDSAERDQVLSEVTSIINHMRFTPKTGPLGMLN
jgi:hypothetical protein